MNADRAALLALAQLVEPGCHELGKLVRRAGAAAALGQVLGGAVSARLAGAVAARLTAEALPDDPAVAERLAERAEARARRLGARIVTALDAEWPPQLADLARAAGATGTEGGGADRGSPDADAPLCLWVRGALDIGAALARSVSLVGARASTPYGRHVAGELAYGLAGAGWTVVSGGAFGIDAAAHRACLTAGGPTVVVLACGIDRSYPQAHTGLFEQVTEQGLVITEWPPGASPFRQRFLVRNRVIAAATRGTAMVEAAARSGARNTLARARRLGRAAMVVPGPVTSDMSVGCHEELRVPGTRLVTNVAEVIEEVGQIGDLAPVPRGPERPLDGLDPTAARLLDAVTFRPARTAEQIAATAGVSGQDARRGLPLLVAAGFITVREGGYRLPADPGSRRPKR